MIIKIKCSCIVVLFKLKKIRKQIAQPIITQFLGKDSFSKSESVHVCLVEDVLTAVRTLWLLHGSNFHYIVTL